MLFISYISMPRRGLVKCSSLFFIVFLMCPRRIRPTALKQQGLLQVLKRSSNDVLDVNVKYGPADWSNIVRQNRDEELQGDNNERGFDLNDDEIRKFKIWPKGIVPYYIDVISFNDKVLRDRIRLFLNTVNSLTKLSFLEMPTPPKDDETRWVFFANRRGQLGCSDHSILNFTNEGVQHVNLGYDCIASGGELAEAVLSIVGVPPQHNSPDRDRYIKVIEDNIMPEKRYLFHKLTNDHWLFHGINYDFSSAGHFHHHKHSATGRATIEFQNPHSTHSSMGENHGFTKSDIKKLRMLYNYIVRKKENKVPECEKLFRKGQSFSFYAVDLPEANPRKKPNKYLGLPDEQNEDYKQEDKDTKENSGECKTDENKRSDVGSDDAEKDTKENSGECTAEENKRSDAEKDTKENSGECKAEENKRSDAGSDDAEKNTKENSGECTAEENKRSDAEKDTKENSGECKAEENKRSDAGSDDAKNYDKEPPATRKMDLKSHQIKEKEKQNKIDLLSYLSDYQTGDEHRRKAVHNKTLKANK